MGPGIPQKAAEVVNGMEASELAEIFFQYGEEPRGKQVAAHLVRVRKTRPFETTLQLADAVCEIIPRRGPRHPATRVFQALRMHVNDELGALRRALNEIPTSLAPGARFAVITFHSIEDRIVILEPDRWLVHPPGWFMVGLAATVPEDSPDRMLGAILDERCEGLALERE